MTCCLLLTLFVGRVAERSGLTGRRAGTRSASVRSRLTDALSTRVGAAWRQWLVALAAVEIAVAWLLVRVFLDLDDGGLRNIARGGTAMIMAGPAAAGSRSAAAVSLMLAATVLAAAAIVLPARLAGDAAANWWANPRACAYCGLIGYAVALLPIVRTAAAGSHLMLMAQIMLLLTVSPALVLAAVTGRPAGSRSVRSGVGWLAPAVAAVYLAVLFAWHLPGAHRAAMVDAGIDWLRIASLAAAGLVLWGFVFGATRTAAVRLGVLLAVGAGSGLLAIAFLVSDRALLPMATAAPFGLTALTDQRLAAVVMMAVDVAVLLPVAAALLSRAAAGEALSAPSPAVRAGPGRTPARP